MSGLYGKRVYDKGIQTTYGLRGGGTAAPTSFIIDNQEFHNNSVSNISSNLTLEVASNKIATLYDQSGVKISVFTLDSNGKINSSSTEQSLAATLSATIDGMVKLADDKIFISSNGDVAVGSISGNTVTLGTKQTMASNAQCVALSATEVLMIINNGNFQIATVTGTSISLSSTFTIGSYTTHGTPRRIQAHAYSSTQVVLSAASNGTLNNGYALHLTINTGTPSGTQDSSLDLSSGTAYSVSDRSGQGVMSSTRFVAVLEGGFTTFDRSGTTLSKPDSEFTGVTFNEFPDSAVAYDSDTLQYIDDQADSSVITLKKVQLASDGSLSAGSDVLNFSCSNAGGSAFQTVRADSGFSIASCRIGNSANSFLNPFSVTQF